MRCRTLYRHGCLGPRTNYRCICCDPVNTPWLIEHAPAVRIRVKRPIRACECGWRVEKPGHPQFMRIAQVFGLSAPQRYQPCLGLEDDRGLLAGTKAIIRAVIGPSATGGSMERWTA
jgi:hypothetical protein